MRKQNKNQIMTKFYQKPTPHYSIKYIYLQFIKYISLLIYYMCGILNVLYLLFRLSKLVDNSVNSPSLKECQVKY